jgi:hypothetical protein
MVADRPSGIGYGPDGLPTSFTLREWYRAGGLDSTWQLATQLSQSAVQAQELGQKQDWQADVEPGSDVELRMVLDTQTTLAANLLRRLASAELIRADPNHWAARARWDAPEQALAYVDTAPLPFDPLFIDLAAANLGSCLAVPLDAARGSWRVTGLLLFRDELAALHVAVFGSPPDPGPLTQPLVEVILSSDAQLSVPTLGQMTVRCPDGHSISAATTHVDSHWRAALDAGFGAVQHGLGLLRALDNGDAELVAEIRTRQARRDAMRRGQQIAKALVPRERQDPNLNS